MEIVILIGSVVLLAGFVVLGIVMIALLTGNFNKKIKALQTKLEHQIQALAKKITVLEGGDIAKDIQESTQSSIDKIEESMPSSILELKDTDEKLDAEVAFSKSVAVEKKEQYQGQTVSQPSAFNRLISKFIYTIVNYFKTGNTVVKIGVIVLFFGVSFLVKFASDQGYLFVPIEIRLIGVAMGAIGLTYFGWCLRLKKPEYGLIVQGGSVGVLFITTFAALKLYQLIPAPLAFLILVGLAGFTAWMAIIQNSRSLAVFGIVGGFLAPVLASTGQGDHVILFSYYALLNVGIVAIAWFKSWRVLNLIGFGFTYVIASGWGILKYQSQHFWTTEPFLILFFLIYIAVPVLFAKRQATKLKSYVDGTLIFGNIFIAFGLQMQLVKSFEYASAFSALFVSLLYLVLARWLFVKNSNNFKLLAEAFIALGVVFATITIPLAFDGHWTAAVWAAEAAGIYWISLRQERILGRVFSSILIFAAGIAFATHYQRGFFAPPILNSFYMGCIMVAMGSLVTSFMGSKYKNKLHANEGWLVPVFFVFGTLWWIIGGYVEIERYLPQWLHETNYAFRNYRAFPFEYLKNVYLLYISLGLFVCSIIGRKLQWNYLSQLSFVLIGFLAFTALRVAFTGEHPFAAGGFLVWPIAFGIYYYILYKSESLSYIHNNLIRYGHASALWLLTLIAAWELGWQVDQFVLGWDTWRIATNGLVLVAIISIILFYTKQVKWPLKKYANDYLFIGAGPILIAAWLWVCITNWSSSGDAMPLAYVPILNPLEAVQAFFMIILPLWLLRIKSMLGINNQQIGIALGITYFFWLNGILMRSIHHFAGVPFHFQTLFASPLVQMALSIYWSMIGIALMIFASKKNYRWLWITGVSLMGMVVIKLFLVDLSKSETIERIISFISVGLILLAVGYFSPIPPKKSINKKDVTA